MNIAEIIGRVAKHGASVLPPKDGAPGTVLMTFAELERYTSEIIEGFDKKLDGAHAAHADSIVELMRIALG